MDNNINNNEQLQDEEIKQNIESAEEVKPDVDDGEEDNRKKLFIILILFLLLCVGLAVGGIYYGLFRGKNNETIKNKEHADLAVVYSKKGFGDTVDSFSSYSSEASAFTYTFYVNNQNDIDLFYDIYLNSDNFVNDINYSIYKNDNLVFKGLLSNKNTKLATTKISSNDTDNYKLYLWSSSGAANYSFEIKVES